MNLRPKSDFRKDGELYDIDKMVIYLNNILPLYNYSLKDVEKALGVSNDLLGGRIRRSKTYEKKGKLINRIDGVQDIQEVQELTCVQQTQHTLTEPSPVNERTGVSKGVAHSTNDFITREEFNALYNELEGLRSILSNLQGVPTLKNDMNIVDREEKSTSKTFRIYPSSLNKLEQFCKLFPQHSKQDIISHILDNFIDNYKI